MKFSFIERNADDGYPHGIELIGLREKVSQELLPAFSAVETGTVERPILKVKLGGKFTFGEVHDLAEDEVRIVYEPHPEYRHRSVNAKLILVGLKNAIGIELLGTSCWSDGRDTELAMRVRVEPQLAGRCE